MENNILSAIEEFVKISDDMKDDELDEALGYIVKLIEKPDIPPKAAVTVIVKLEALAAKFAFAQSYYKTFGKLGTDERYKKDIYYTAREATVRLVDSLKYIVRASESRW